MFSKGFKKGIDALSSILFLYKELNSKNENFNKNEMRNLLKRTRNRMGLRDSIKNRILQDTQFTALFYIRSTNAHLDKDLTEILNSLKELENLNRRSGVVFKINLLPETNDQWMTVLTEISNSSTLLKEQFTYLKKNIAKKNTLNSTVFWLQNQSYITSIAENYKSLEKIGLQVLPEEEKLYWRTCICNTQDEIFSLIASLANICKVELDFIEKYILDTVDVTSQNIINSIPPDCSLEEATSYHQYYQNALDHYNNDSERKQNIWDKLLYVLGRDTHRFPSDHGLHER